MATQAGVSLGVPQCVQLELRRDQNQPAVAGDQRVMFSQLCQVFDGIRMASKGSRHRLDSLTYPFFEQGKEDVFLAVEIRVERTARVSGARGYVFEARCFEALLREYSFGGIEQFSTCGSGALGLPRTRVGGARDAPSAVLAVREQGERPHAIASLCLTGYIRVCILLACPRRHKPQLQNRTARPAFPADSATLVWQARPTNPEESSRFHANFLVPLLPDIDRHPRGID